MLKKFVFLLIYAVSVVSPALLIDPNKTEFKVSPPRNGYAFFENLDAGSYTDDNGQAVTITAPTMGPITTGFVAILNNVKTDTLYFLQNGVSRYLGTNIVAYTSNNPAWNLTPQIYTTLPYTVGVNYRFNIYYTNSEWRLCAYDTSNIFTLVCIVDPSATGTQLQANINTSVFAEVRHTRASWHNGFSSPWYVSNAKILRNNVAQDWTSSHKHTGDACALPYPPELALKSTLANNGTGRFVPANIPIRRRPNPPSPTPIPLPNC